MCEKYKNSEYYIIKIQKCFRGYIVRILRLPLILYKIQKYLQICEINLSKISDDGRINSSIDENIKNKLLVKKYNEKIIMPKIRSWYDILIYDNLSGWIPINIKLTTMTTGDNIGNLSLCVHSYTNEKLSYNKLYNNGIMSNILYRKLKNKEYNMINKKDYYFIVVNKKNTNEIIINSIKGLEILTPNINNLPFQVYWKKNKIYRYKNIKDVIKLFINCIQKPKPSWKEIFLSDIRTIDNY